MPLPSRSLPSEGQRRIASGFVVRSACPHLCLDTNSPWGRGREDGFTGKETGRGDVDLGAQMDSMRAETCRLQSHLLNLSSLLSPARAQNCPCEGHGHTKPSPVAQGPGTEVLYSSAPPASSSLESQDPQGLSVWGLRESDLLPQPAGMHSSSAGCEGSVQGRSVLEVRQGSILCTFVGQSVT